VIAVFDAEVLSSTDVARIVVPPEDSVDSISLISRRSIGVAAVVGAAFGRDDTRSP
jgi:hypothetical protein